MRILHLINDLRLAGAERFVTDLSCFQKTSGLDVSVATLTPYGSPFEEKVREAGVPLLMPDNPVPVRSPAHVSRLRGLIRGFDLIHVQLFPAQMWAAIAASTLGKSSPPLITTEQNTHNTRRDIPLFRPIDRSMYARYARIAAISEGTRDAMAQYLPETAGKITVIHNGIDPERFVAPGSPEERARLFPGVPPNVPLLICIGRLEPQKDFPNLLRAFAQVPDAHLAIVGIGPLQSELEALTVSLAVRERVLFLGRRDDIPALLRNADLYVQGSAWEGFGIAAVEAMASALPLVITAVPGLREVVADAGVSVPPGDPAAFAAAVNALLADPERRSSLSGRARERSRAFSIAASAAAYRELYEKVA